MADDDRVLVDRLRASECIAYYDDEPGMVADEELLNEVADRIEVLSAENERLREALGWFLNDSRFVVQVGGNPNVVPQMIEAARAAFGEAK